MPQIEFQFFGPPRFRLDGKPVRIGRRKAVALIAYLAVTGKSHSREKLATMFWPESSHRQARASLRKILSLVTKQLGRSWLAIDRETIGFIPHKDLWVDVNRFRELSLTAAPESGNQCGENLEPMADFEVAAKLCGRSFLSGFFVGDAPDFEDWQLDQTEQLDRLAAVVLSRLVRQDICRKAYSRAVPHARRLVSLDPLDEEAQRLLIHLLDRAGDTGMALRQYEKCKKLLKTELDVSPAKETRALVENIRKISGKKPVGIDTDPFPSMTNLPAQVTRFVGRKDEIKSLAGQMASQEVRLLTLTGPGGIGKTRLALELADTLKDDFLHGVFFIGMADLGSRQELVAEMIKVLGLRSDREAIPEEQLFNFLKFRKILLVMDNFEHLSQGGVLVSRLLAQTACIKILVTSRSRLMLQGEHLFRVGELSRPIAPLTGRKNDRIRRYREDYDAVALFLSAARMVQPEYQLDENSIHGVLKICDLTGGMPLALIMAAAWVDLFPAEKIADRIQESLDFLRVEIRDMPLRHQSIRAVFDSSWAGLVQKEKDLLMKLSVALHGFTVEAVSSVTDTDPGSTIRLTAGLARKSLLKVNPETGRFEIHPLLRQYAWDRLSSSGLTEAVLDAHKRYYLELAHEKEQGLISEAMLSCRGEMDDEIPNIRQAWLRASVQRDLASLGLAAPGLYVYFDMHTRYHEGRNLFQPAGEIVLEMAREKTEPVMALILLCWLDMAGEEQIEPGQASELWSRAGQCLRLAVKQGDPRGRAFSLLLMGALAYKEAAWDRAIRLFRLSREGYPEIEKAFWVSVRMGLCHQAQGRMDNAVQHFKMGEKAGAIAGDEIKKAWALCNIGICELGQGSLNAAETNIQVAAQSFDQICAPIGMITATQALCLISFIRGDLATADILIDKALGAFEDLGLTQSNYRNALALKGLIAIAAGHPGRAETLLRQAQKQVQPSYMAHIGIVFLACQNNDLPTAEYNLGAALDTLPSVFPPHLYLLVLLARAAVKIEKGLDRQSAAMLGFIYHHPHYPAGLFRAWDLPGHLLEQVKSRMGPKTFGPAWEQGKSNASQIISEEGSNPA